MPGEIPQNINLQRHSDHLQFPRIEYSLDPKFRGIVWSVDESNILFANKVCNERAAAALGKSDRAIVIDGIPGERELVLRPDTETIVCFSQLAGAEAGMHDRQEMFFGRETEFRLEVDLEGGFSLTAHESVNTSDAVSILKLSEQDMEGKSLDGLVLFEGKEKRTPRCYKHFDPKVIREGIVNKSNKVEYEEVVSGIEGTSRDLDKGRLRSEYFEMVYETPGYVSYRVITSSSTEIAGGDVVISDLSPILLRDRGIWKFRNYKD